MPTTTSVTSDLHHEVRGSGPPGLFIAGADGAAGHFARTVERLADDAAALIEELGLMPAIGTSGRGDIALDLIAHRPEAVRGASVHEPALIALAGETEAADDQLAPIVELAAAQPRRAIEAFIRTVTSYATFESLDRELRELELESISGHHAPYLQQPEAFAEELRPVLKELS